MKTITKYIHFIIYMRLLLWPGDYEFSCIEAPSSIAGAYGFTSTNDVLLGSPDLTDTKCCNGYFDVCRRWNHGQIHKKSNFAGRL